MSPLLQSSFRQQILSVLLTVSFLFVSTALTQNLSVHLEHVGHDQQTHEQNWCSWSCQGGPGLHVLPPFVENSPQVLSFLDIPRPVLPDLDCINQPNSRGPPLHLT